MRESECVCVRESVCVCERQERDIDCTYRGRLCTFRLERDRERVSERKSECVCERVCV